VPEIDRIGLLTRTRSTRVGERGTERIANSRSDFADIVTVVSTGFPEPIMTRCWCCKAASVRSARKSPVAAGSRLIIVISAESYAAFFAVNAMSVLDSTTTIRA